MKNKKIILGIDQSLTSTGLVVLDSEKNLVHHEVVKTKKQTHEMFETYDRITQIVAKIQEVHRLYRVNAVAIEGLSYASSTNATRDLAALQCVIIIMLRNLERLNDNNIRVFSPTALKKYAASAGNADKQAMFEALPDDISQVFEKYKKSGGRHDLTDAYHLAAAFADNVESSKPEKSKRKTRRIDDVVKKKY